MSVITDTVRGLIQRRLWPVAVGLAAGVAAVPFVLAEEPEEVPAAATPAAALLSASDDPTSKLVSLADASARERGRRVAGTVKDPFAVPTAAKSSAVKKQSSSSVASKASTSSSSSSDGSAKSSGGSGPSTTTTTPAATATPQPTATATPSPTYPINSLSVRWSAGADAAESETQVLRRLEALPDPDQPLIIYLGLLEDGKTAAFLLNETVSADGDGTCLPSPRDCQTVHLKAGETEFFEVAASGEEGSASEQYQLDVVKVHAKRTSSRSKALAAYKQESKAGRRALRSRLARSRRYKYDESTGRVRQLRGKALRRVLARGKKRDARST
jgi:hypothetical protein